EYRLRVAAEKPTDEQLRVIDRQIEDLLLEHRQVQAQIRDTSPTYAALAQPEKLSVKDIQRLLDPDTLLLEYSLGEDCSYLWVVGEHSLDLFALPGRWRIESAARQVYDLLTLRNGASEKPVPNEQSFEAEYIKAA